MASNVLMYLHTDENQYVDNFSSTETDGYTKIFVPADWIYDFIRLPNKFSVIDGALRNPGNTPKITNETIKKDMSDMTADVLNLKTSNETLKKDKDDLQSKLASMSDMLSQQLDLLTLLAPATDDQAPTEDTSITSDSASESASESTSDSTSVSESVSESESGSLSESESTSESTKGDSK